ncbi:hypothetical protein ASD19_12610 [Microbacterium sp. Root53]|uniref:hypothetical protein n=1 Tax=Microbacterium sp. Root53 TaxID=1736553 RepID=UPI0007007016|nr:hypothetical protein [Microbacterium sp. Root53]KQZ07198.1 hypothetical protein ASD19_12610 [Microbacterium sp. Root53]
MFDALARDDWRVAARLVAEDWAALIARDATVIEAVADAMPAEAFDEHPEWIVARSYARHLRLDASVRPLVYADLAPEPDPADSARVAAILWTSRAGGARTGGDLPAALDYVARARAAAAAAGGELEQVLPNLQFQWALSHLLADDAPTAIGLLAEAYAGAEATGNSRTQINASGELAWLFALGGRGVDADAWLARHERLRAEHPDVTAVHVSGAIARSIRAWDRVDLPLADELIGAIRLREAGERIPFLAGGRLMVRSRLDVACTAALLSEFDTVLSALPPHLDAVPFLAQHNRIIRSEALLMRGNAAAAIRMFTEGDHSTGPFAAARRAISYLLVDDAVRAESEASSVIAAETGRLRLVIEAHLVRAALAQRAGDGAGAADELRLALDLARAHTCFMPFSMIPLDELRALTAAVPGAAGAACAAGAIASGRMTAVAATAAATAPRVRPVAPRASAGRGVIGCICAPSFLCVGGSCGRDRTPGRRGATLAHCGGGG